MSPVGVPLMASLRLVSLLPVYVYVRLSTMVVLLPALRCRVLIFPFLSYVIPFSL